MEKANENQQSEPFYKYRGVTKCLSAGISFLTDNFWYIIKLSLPVALIYAALNAALAFIVSDTGFYQSLVTISTAPTSSQIMLCASVCVLWILSLLASCLSTGLIYRLMHIHSHDLPLRTEKMSLTLKCSVGYGLKVLLFMLVPFVIVMMCSAGSTILLKRELMAEGAVFPWISLGVVAVIFVLLLVLALPLSVAMPSMFLEQGRAVRNAFYGYKKGLRVWGKLFCLALLLTLLVGVLVIVLSMPALTMISCYHAATFSLFDGDQVSLPAGFAFGYAVVLFLSYYLLFFISWLVHTPFCYIYASIKHDEVEEASSQFKL